MAAREAALRVRVRRGRIRDLEQVKEFTRTTFSWGDYLPEAWAPWVRSRRGVLLVAEIDSQVVGTCHLRLLEHREGWLEGLRVHPAYRKQGIASVLIQAIHTHASKNNCRVVRLETASHNVVAHHAFEKFGYRCLVPYEGFAAGARDGELDSIRRAKLKDLKTCWRLWECSWLRRASRAVVPAPYGWRWWELTPSRLRDEIRAGHVWMTQQGFMTLRLEDDAFDVTLLVGSKRDARKLLDAARVLAHRQQRNKVYWLAPRSAFCTRRATDAGYTIDEDGLLIYACAL